jgi:hypothetical protein
MNRMKNNEQQQNSSSQQQQQQQNPRHQSVDDGKASRPAPLRTGSGPTPMQTHSIQDDSSFSPMASGTDSQIPHINANRHYSVHLSPASQGRQTSSRLHPASPGEDRIEALINAAQHLEPGVDTPWRSPSPMLISRPDNGPMQNRNHHESMGPPIDPAMEVLSFSPAGHVSSLDQWAFELVQSNNPIPNRTPADALQTWLFPMDNDGHTSNGPHSLGAGVDSSFFDSDTFRAMQENQASPSGSSASIASRVPRERFQRVQNCWPSRNRRSSRLMPDLWQSLVSSDCTNILCDSDARVVDTPASERQRKNQRWGVDEDCRGRLQNTLNNLPPSNLLRSESVADTMSSSGDAAGSPSLEGIQFPPAEILDIALEMYLYYFHPTLPIIHIPTFSAKNAPRPLLLCMCLIGLSILGTTGAAKFVTRIFPVRQANQGIRTC